MKTQTSTHGIRSRIHFGFFIVALLMVALTFVGLKHMAQVNTQIKNIVENNNVKIELGHVMKNTLHERALSMHSVAVLRDEFLQDEEFMHFNRLGAKYVQARQKLESLSLTDNEEMILDKIKTLTKETQPYVQEVIQLGLESNDDAIFDKIRDLAIPNQRLIAEQLQTLVDLQQDQAKIALEEEESSYQNARTLMLLLGGLATILAILIAYFVSRHVTKQANLLEHKALHDELTGLANRLLFHDRLQTSIMRGQRQAMFFSTILLDLDGFKMINDTLGHNIGDLVLKEVARRLKNNVRKTDTVARLGGDEFVIIFESLERDRVIQFADKIERAIAEPFLLGGKKIDVGVSMGIASYPENGQDCETLVNRADIAMYAAKRNNVPYICYTDDIKSSNLKAM